MHSTFKIFLLCLCPSDVNIFVLVLPVMNWGYYSGVELAILNEIYYGQLATACEGSHHIIHFLCVIRKAPVTTRPTCGSLTVFVELFYCLARHFHSLTYSIRLSDVQTPWLLAKPITQPTAAILIKAWTITGGLTDAAFSNSLSPVSNHSSRCKLGPTQPVQSIFATACKLQQNALVCTASLKANITDIRESSCFFSCVL